MIVALRSGSPVEGWLEDPAALVTALELLEQSDRARIRARGR